MQRHNFAGGAGARLDVPPRTGLDWRLVYPSRVVKGMRTAGHMGRRRVTTRNLKVARIDTENHLLILAGAVPGAANGYVHDPQGGRRQARTQAAARAADKGKAR